MILSLKMKKIFNSIFIKLISFYKWFSQLSWERILIFILLLLMLLGWLVHNAQMRAGRIRLEEITNRLAAAQSSLEIADGVQMRIAEEYGRLDRHMQDVLGTQSLLIDLLDDSNDQIDSLMQVNGTLSERIRFIGNSSGGRVRTTVVNELLNNTTFETDQDNSGEQTILPNLRVDFDMESSGFRVIGYTHTNPSEAVVELEQLQPFIIDLAITQTRDGYRALASEQTGRLELEIGELAIARNTRRERWSELIGIGAAAYVSGNSFAVGPAVHIETRGRLDIMFGPVYSDSYDSKPGSVGGQLAVTFRPFRR